MTNHSDLDHAGGFVAVFLTSCPVHTFLAIVLGNFGYLDVVEGDIPYTVCSAKAVVSSNSFPLAVLCKVNK